MKLAESVRLRWVLAAASIACAASATAIIASHHAVTRAPVVAIQRHELPFVGGCHQHKKHHVPVAPAPAPPPKTTGDKYGDALLAIRPALDACMAKSSAEVTYRVSTNIAANGSVLSVDVRSEAKDMRKVSLKTTQCLERAVQTATFPTSESPTRVSTVLHP